MSTLLDPPTVRADGAASSRLRATMAAMRLSITWLGVRKALSNEQKAQAADTFGAEGQFLSAGKKLLDTRDPAFRAVTSVRSRATAFFRGSSLPFPEPGIRLVRQDELASIELRMGDFRAELAEAVERLGDRLDDLKAAAQQRLGRLFDAADYPASLHGQFELAWDFPSIEAPSYLRQLSPQLYEEETRRVQARFEEAVRLAESAFTDEFARLVSHLTERLSGADDGKPKVFRDSAVTNLHEFFQRFRHLQIGNHEELEQLVSQAQSIVTGVEPQQLRDNTGVRANIATQLAGVQATLDGMLVDRPRRAILRRPR